MSFIAFISEDQFQFHVK